MKDTLERSQSHNLIFPHETINFKGRKEAHMHFEPPTHEGVKLSCANFSLHHLTRGTVAHRERSETCL